MKKTNQTATSTPAAAWLPLEDLAAWDKNPNRHPPAQLAQLAAAIRRFGFIDPVTVALIESEGVQELRAGHGRVEALRAILAEDPGFIPRGAPGPGLVRAVVHAFPTRAAADAYGLADNRLSMVADPDGDAIAALLRDLDADGFSLDGLGWEQGELDALVNPASPDDVKWKTFDETVGDGVPPATDAGNTHTPVTCPHCGEEFTP